MEKKIIVRIANGFGNQLFLYATAFAFAKRLGYKLFVDKDSAFYEHNVLKKKNYKFPHWVPEYKLGAFNISAPIADKKFIFADKKKYIKRKYLKLVDKFRKNKRFLVEKKNGKSTKFSNSYLNKTYDKNIFLEGFFESEKYFKDYRNEIKNEYSFNHIPDVNQSYLNMIKDSNSVSIALRRDRYSETEEDNNNLEKIEKSKIFEESTIKYIYNAVSFFKKKIPNAKFFLFSDIFEGLEKKFNPEIFTMINSNHVNKPEADFYLMTQCKHFIVGPTSFHWWPAWLCNYEEKIIVCPKDLKLNASSNANFWPEAWIKI